MAQHIDKSAIVAEIERRRRDWRYGSSIEAKFKREECDDILSFLDTLETKEMDEEYNGKAMLHVLEKGVEQGRRELIDKACEWLKKWDAYRVCLEGNKDWFIEQFRKAMKE